MHSVQNLTIVFLYLPRFIPPALFKYVNIALGHTYVILVAFVLELLRYWDAKNLVW